MKTGILGSAFNPPHLGHLAVADRAKAHLGLDRVILVPTRKPPHKKITEGWTPDERLFMSHLTALDLDARELWSRLLKLIPDTVKSAEARASELTELYDILRAHSRDKTIEVSNIEWEITEERSWTVDTLTELSWKFPDDRFTLLIGKDQAEAFDQWKETDGIRKLAKIAVADRGDGGLKDVLTKFPYMDPFPFPRLDISSSELRERSAKKMSLMPYVPPAVGFFTNLVRARNLS